jgi:hypothetical protein
MCETVNLSKRGLRRSRGGRGDIRYGGGGEQRRKREILVSWRMIMRTLYSTLIKIKKINFFSEEFFTINKEIFPYCQRIISYSTLEG